MTSINAIATAVLGTLLLASAVAQAKPAPRSPTARWVVDFAEQQCVASLSYGDRENPLFLALKPSPLGEVMQIIVAKKAGSFQSPDQLPIRIGFDDQPLREFSMLAINGKKGAPDNFRINLTMGDFAPMRMAKRISIVSGTKLDESFELVQMAAVLKAMDECVVDLRRHWNIDPALQSTLQSRAKGDLVSLFSSDDYPGVSLRHREGGVVGMVLLIDEQGKVADCMVTETSKSAALDSQACVIMMLRAKYAPAIGENGKPAKDSDVARIRWEVP